MRVALIALAASLTAAAADEPRAPIASGEYEFQWRDAEHPDISGPAVRVIVSGDRIKVIAADASSTPVAQGNVIDEGVLMWHAPTKQWIIGNDESDKTAKDVGGCSDGPAVIDLERRIYWFC